MWEVRERCLPPANLFPPGLSPTRGSTACTDAAPPVLTCMGDAASGWTLWKKRELHWQQEPVPTVGSGESEFCHQAVTSNQGRTLNCPKPRFSHL